jgi:hypothetical protein
MFMYKNEYYLSYHFRLPLDGPAPGHQIKNPVNITLFYKYKKKELNHRFESIKINKVIGFNVN